MKPVTMKSMEMTDDEKLDAVMPIPMSQQPDYPYGLRLSLTEAEFEKLDLSTEEAEVGGTLHGHFMGRITSVSENDTPNGKCCRVEIQIEELSIESEDAENKD